ncbi:hypothetical protein [Natronospira bacteriovora]|uniref:SPW repeat-containing protein n=1 Tax=Natronospira bacteriovora TaxID=3069753 RepID=A0ABU0W9L8_9GAMM|nr:hypothetical protein [Natronospira sp. AB-CW4]MDQ2070652.1 hypothetical protein [Natronospira sp. AB-CW4]
MRRAPSQNRHREWIRSLLAFADRGGWVLGLLLVATGLALFCFEQGALSALAAAVPAGILSAYLGHQYHQGGDESHWLMMILAFFAGWPLVMLLERNGTPQLEQNLITVQYFLLVIGLWLLVSALLARRNQERTP